MRFISNNIKRIWEPANLPEFIFFFVAIWTLIVLLSGIPYGDLSGFDDAAYAHEGKVMLQSGDWWTMRLNGVPDFDKPPLFIWLITLSFKFFGTTDFAAKIPAVLFGWATVILTYFLAKELFSKEFSDELEDSATGKWVPVLAMLIMATTQYFLKYASHAMTDVPFTFFFALAIYFYVRVRENSLFLLACGLATGLATMTRSPMGLFPLCIFVLHLAYTRDWKSLFSLNFIGCLLLSIAVPATWFWYEYRIFGDVFIQRHFGNFLAHSLSATTEALSGTSRTGWQQFLWYFQYLSLIVQLYFPWFPLMFYGLFLAFRKMRKQSAPTEALLVFWFFVVLVPFSLVESKVFRYIMPVFPAFAVLSAYALHRLLAPKRLTIFFQVAVLILSLAAFVAALFPNYLVRAGDMRTLATVTDSELKPDEKIVLYTAGELKANYLNQLLWYGNHLCIFVKNFKDVEENLSGDKQTVVVMDKASFSNFKKDSNISIKILKESENFVCFRRDF